MPPPDVSIVIPVYEEEASLAELAEEIRQAMAAAGRTFEVWMIDDGSRDGSWEEIERLHAEDARFAGVRFRRNYGKSAALAVGFQRATGRYVATLDADLQDDPAELPAMLQQLDGGLDLVSGWKRRRHDPLGKTIPSRFFNKVTRVASGIPLHDFNSGIKAYRIEVVKSVKVYGELHRYIPLLAKWEGYTRIGEHVVQHRARKHGTTKFGLERFIRGFLDLVSVTFLTRYAVRPMHFFGGIGSLCFTTGFLISLWLAFDKLILGHPIGDRPLLLLGALLILFGGQLFTTGLLGETLIRPEMERTDTYQLRSELTSEHRERTADEEPPSGNGASRAPQRERSTAWK